jgi:hypothetical protein
LREVILKENYFMIYLQPEEQLALKYILKNWVMVVIGPPNHGTHAASKVLDTYLDLAKDLDGLEPESFVLPMQRAAVFRVALEHFYNILTIPQDQRMIAAKHYEMLAKWFFEDKVAMTKDEVLNIGSHYNIL